MRNRKNAFTMIELVFVIVVLGILSAIAVPKFASTKNMANISKARSDVEALRSSIISERQSQLIKGINSYIPKLCSDASDTTLFLGDGNRTLLTYGVVAGTTDGRWSTNGDSCKKFNFKTDNIDVVFDYNATSGIFSCDRDDDTYGDICKKIVD